jgi:ATP-dependent helicase/nuclease subunit A
MIPNKPKDVIWTDNQWQAIHSKGHNILVSAGAGSGKTAVLKQRVTQHVLSGTDITSLLILTFTKAAALEMKQRITKSLIEASQKDKSLKKQLPLIEQAHISTFDAFALFVAKKYAHLIGISKDMSIMDTIVLKRLKSRLCDEYFEELYESDDALFHDLLKRYTDRKDNALKQLILLLLDDVINDPKYMENASSNSIKYISSKTFAYKMMVKAEHIYREQVSYLPYFINELSQIAINDKEITYTQKLMSIYEQLSSAEDYDEMVLITNNIKIPNKPSKQFEDFKESFDRIKNDFANIINALKNLLSESKDDVYKSFSELEPYSKSIQSIVLNILKRYKQYQKKHGTYDYQTLATLALEMVESNEVVKNELKNQFFEILVDEYQDTNPLQNAFVKSISNNNLFLVGDIKQSIYGFRNAEPTLFSDTYKAYEKSATDEVIVLNQNFRSRKEVLEDINAIFSSAFDERLGGIDYDHTQAMNFGLTDYDQAVFDTDYGVSIIQSDYSDEREENTISESTLLEFEIKTICEDIIEKIKNKHQVFDPEEKQLRDVRLDDFVILIDRTKNFFDFKRVFDIYELPLFVHKSNEYAKNHDVLVLFSLLKLIYAMQNEPYAKTHFMHSFLSILYSYIYEIDTNQIIMFALNAKEKDIQKTKELIKEFGLGDVLQPIESLSENALYQSLSEIVSSVIKTFNLLVKSIYLEDVNQVENRLIFFKDKAVELESLGYSLSDFIDYIDYILQNANGNSWEAATDIEFSSGTKIMPNMINIMTIHKSKGLEFPIVYYPSLGKQWKMKSYGKTIYDQNHGFILQSYTNHIFQDTITKKVFKYEERMSELSEKIRLFYVALTRAREHMIIIDTNFDQLESKPTMFYDYAVNHLEDFSKSQVVPLTPLAIRSNYRRFIDLIHSVYPIFSERVKTIPATSDDIISKSGKINALDFIEDQPLLLDIEYKQFEYEEETIVFSTATTWKPTIFKQDVIDVMDLGTTMHLILEVIDPHKNIDDQLSELMIESSLKEMIKDFFAHPFTQSLLSGTFISEYQFVDKEDTLIKRGIIDLLVVTEDHFVIIDYKLSNTNKDEYISQLQTYITYLQKTFNKPAKAYLYSLVNRTFHEVTL